MVVRMRELHCGVFDLGTCSRAAHSSCALGGCHGVLLRHEKSLQLPAAVPFFVRFFCLDGVALRSPRFVWPGRLEDLWTNHVLAFRVTCRNAGFSFLCCFWSHSGIPSPSDDMAGVMSYARSRTFIVSM